MRLSLHLLIEETNLEPLHGGETQFSLKAKWNSQNLTEDIQDQFAETKWTEN